MRRDNLFAICIDSYEEFVSGIQDVVNRHKREAARELVQWFFKCLHKFLKKLEKIVIPYAEDFAVAFA